MRAAPDRRPTCTPRTGWRANAAGRPSSVTLTAPALTRTRCASSAALGDRLRQIGPEVVRAIDVASDRLARVARVVGAAVTWVAGAAVLLMALSFAAAVIEWLGDLPDGAAGAEVGEGGVLILAACPLAWLTGLGRHRDVGWRESRFPLAAAHAIFRVGILVVIATFAVLLLG